MKNLVQLAKLFDNFIELDSSFVRVDDIKAITKHTNPGVGGTLPNKSGDGIDVITPYGTFHDSTDFDTFKTRIEDTLAALKATEMVKPVEVTRPARIVPMENEPRSGRVEQSNETIPTPRTNPVTDREATIRLTGNGSTGTLFEDPGMKVVNRSALQVLGPDGMLVASGTGGGTIVGETISGIVYESGRYTFAAKNYPGDSITVHYQIQRR